MARFYLPSAGPEGWRAGLRDPERQWREGFSARTLAYCWEDAHGGWPPSVKRVFDSSGFDLLANATMLFGFPEHAVAVGGAGGDSKTDLWLLARSGEELISVAVEGKVDETLGERVGQWAKRREADAEKRKRPTNAPLRRRLLEERLGLRPEETDDLRYQLLHRAASALIEAERFSASTALMLVHSFGDARTGFDDFRSFVQAMGGAPPADDGIASVGRRAGIELFLGWVTGESRYLTAHA